MTDCCCYLGSGGSFQPLILKSRPPRVPAGARSTIGDLKKSLRVTNLGHGRTCGFPANLRPTEGSLRRVMQHPHRCPAEYEGAEGGFECHREHGVTPLVAVGKTRTSDSPRVV
jgi:hypothetical protein